MSKNPQTVKMQYFHFGPLVLRGLGKNRRFLTGGVILYVHKTLAAQGILTYCATRPLPYHLYADEGELLVFGAPLTSGSLSKKEFSYFLHSDCICTNISSTVTFS